MKQLYELSYFSKKRFEDRFNYIILLITKLKVKTILDVGCGGGVYTKELKKLGYNVTSFDKNVEFEGVIKGDITHNLPFKDNTFDLVLCIGVLQILDYKYVRKSFDELKRVTKKYIIVDFENSEFIINKIISHPAGKGWTVKTIYKLTDELTLIKNRHFAINKYINFLLNVTHLNIFCEYSVSLYCTK